MNELIQGVGRIGIYKLTQGRRRMTQVDNAEKEGWWPGRCPQYWTNKVIRDRDRIISLPENSLMMLNWLRCWN